MIEKTIITIDVLKNGGQDDPYLEILYISIKNKEERIMQLKIFGG